LASSASRCLGDKVAVVSITRAVRAGTGSRSCARAGPLSSASSAHTLSSFSTSISTTISTPVVSVCSGRLGVAGLKLCSGRMGARYLDAAGAGLAGLSKLTAGGAEMAASFCTVKLGLTA